MKRLVILCDGTWNKSDAVHPTNVMQLARAIARTDAKGVVQQVIYVSGVGSGRGTSWFSKTKDKLTGGVFGWGLSNNIEEAYWHLAFNYEPGDEIYIFGFSRGAFTARSLAGLIRSCGIPPEDKIREIPKAMAIYKSRGKDTHPDAQKSLDFRAAFSPLVATSEVEMKSRRKLETGAANLLKIAFLGVWDTVGSLGVPNQMLISGWINRKYQFHDYKLSGSVSSAWHAVAVDERRKTFMPTLWDNLEDMNGGKTGADAAYQQLWFPGDHGSVGGGGDIQLLSGRTLQWIAQGAERQGLAVNWAVLKPTTVNTNHRGPLVNTSKPFGLIGKMLRWSSADRVDPANQCGLSDFAQNRLSDDPGYRPQTLSQFWPR